VTPYRTLLAEAVRARLAAALPGVTVERGRRAQVERQERPLVSVSTGEMATSYEDQVPLGMVRLETEVIVSGFPSPATQDAALHDTLAQMEAAIVQALQGVRLTAAGAPDLTEGLEFINSAPEPYDAESSAPRLGEIQVTFRASMLAAQGVLSI
jgi:hypothetical protein